MKRTALVTGASSGIGEATVRVLLKRGYEVYAGARRLERMKPLEAEGAKLLALDVTDDASMVAAIDAINRETSRLDVLVNNAGYGSYGSLEEVPLEEGRRQFEVNVFGLARLTQLAIGIMRPQGSGKIVNITSVGGKVYEPFGSWYHATKFAVEGMSDCLRMELAPFGIDVIVVEPGAIKTEWNEIARTNLLQYSGAGPYKVDADQHANMLASADSSGAASEPIVVAKTIGRAIKARRPKTRYPAGGGASMVLFVRKMVSDRTFDNIMLSARRNAAKPKKN